MKHLNATHHTHSQNGVSALPLYAPFLLLIRWMLGWAVSGQCDQSMTPRPVFRRRHQWLHDLQGITLPRRLRRRKASQIRRNAVRANDYIPFFTLLDDTKSKRDFNEKMTRVSAYGRIYLYGMRGFKLLPLSKATRVLTAFCKNAMPVKAAVNSGLWDVHAVPD